MVPGTIEIKFICRNNFVKISVLYTVERQRIGHKDRLPSLNGHRGSDGHLVIRIDYVTHVGDAMVGHHSRGGKGADYSLAWRRNADLERVRVHDAASRMNLVFRKIVGQTADIPQKVDHVVLIDPPQIAASAEFVVVLKIFENLWGKK